jgi:hypothetical protein
MDHSFDQQPRQVKPAPGEPEAIDWAAKLRLRGVVGDTGKLEATCGGWSYEDGSPVRRYWLTPASDRGAVGLLEAHVAGKYAVDYVNLLEASCLDDLANAIAPMDGGLRWLVWLDLQRFGFAAVFAHREAHFFDDLPDDPPEPPSRTINVLIRGLSRPALRALSRITALANAELLIEEDR